MIDQILLIGQASIHWGRIEFGNMGNYYVIETLIRELHRVFPDTKLVTTLQLSDTFCKKEYINVLPLDMYYQWRENELELAKEEYLIAKQISETGNSYNATPFIKEVLKSDLIIDISGDMWGENADLAGDNRFLVGLYKNKTVQILQKKNVLFLVSPGPFNSEYINEAKEVYRKFDKVVLREPVSRELLYSWGFDLSKTFDGACQSVLFEPIAKELIKNKIIDSPLFNKKRPVIGLILCGWNFKEGPYNKKEYKISEFDNFIKIIEYCTTNLGADVCLLSHSNGFELNPDFKLKRGVDFKILEQLYSIVETKPYKDNVYLFDKLCTPQETKAIIGCMDMLISGRVHGAIAGLSSFVPTVIINYGHGPKPHKLKGFSELYGVGEYLANPNILNDLLMKIAKCFNNRDTIKAHLHSTVPKVIELAHKSTEMLKDL